MLVIASARGVGIVITVARTKVLALLLGPAGVGLLSIYNNLQTMVSGAAGLGMRSSGVRQIARAREDTASLGRVRKVLAGAHFVQGVIAAAAIWLLRSQISQWLFGDTSRSLETGLIGIAVLFTLLGSAQTALLQGLRQIGDLGRVTVLGSLLGTAAGLTAVWLTGEEGLVWFVITQPATAFLVAHHYTRRLAPARETHLTPGETFRIWKPMARLGLAFTLGGLASAGTLLLVRGRISDSLGLDAAGQFAASWSIANTYIGLLLSAMAADYYPRLAEIIHDKPAASDLMNVQSQLALAFGGPILLLMIGLAPWVIGLLYSDDFAPAARILQWQTLGNVFKLACWPLGFAMVAAGRARLFLFVQLHFNALFLALLLPSLSRFGLIAAGPSFGLAYVIHFLVLYALTRHVHTFRWRQLSLKLLVLHTLLASALFLLARQAPLAAAVAAPLFALLTALYGLRIVLQQMDRTGRFSQALEKAFTLVGWPL